MDFDLWPADLKGPKKLLWISQHYHYKRGAHRSYSASVLKLKLWRKHRKRRQTAYGEVSVTKLYFYSLAFWVIKPMLPFFFFFFVVLIIGRFLSLY